MAASIFFVLMVSVGVAADQQIIMKIDGMTCRL